MLGSTFDSDARRKFLPSLNQEYSPQYELREMTNGWQTLPAITEPFITEKLHSLKDPIEKLNINNQSTITSTDHPDEQKQSNRDAGLMSATRRKRRKRKKASMFARMSLEAQTAISEARQEMKSGTEAEEEDGAITSQRNSSVVANELADRLAESYTKLQTVSHSKRTLPRLSHTGSNITLPRITKRRKSNQTIQIIQSKAPTLHTAARVLARNKRGLNRSFPLPDLTLEDAEETPQKSRPFEITPLGYDSRYLACNIQNFSEDEDEVTRIASDATRKCQHWLTYQTESFDDTID